MNPRPWWALSIALVAIPMWSFSQVPRNTAQPATANRPKLEAVAETQLIMEALAQANYRALTRQLKDKPQEVEAWKFARGQALILAETGNLLLLRPPRGQGQDIWMARAVELRETSNRLARTLSTRDYTRSRLGMVEVANVCNRCHQSFRIKVEVTPFADSSAIVD